ncbi:hypothetical protein F511_18683 [Dorcoceras hygrometricum]|uniref:Uncharacterized protein n=1 Tax=Dorcoceras hygrometricum TaxID=472368 RepID=A0A2Z7BZG5_9LAMI|nr:hypothetical protein F511_18683 [Dorcoceras hygrometricum]
MVFLDEPSWLYDYFSSAAPACRIFLVQGGHIELVSLRVETTLNSLLTFQLVLRLVFQQGIAYSADSSFELFPKLVFLDEPSWLYDDFSSAPPACRIFLVQGGHIELVSVLVETALNSLLTFQLVLRLVVQQGIAYSVGDQICTRSLRLYLSSHSITALVRCT